MNRFYAIGLMLVTLSLAGTLAMMQGCASVSMARTYNSSNASEPTVAPSTAFSPTPWVNVPGSIANTAPGNQHSNAPTSDEELWVVAKPDRPALANVHALSTTRPIRTPQDEIPGCGALLATTSTQKLVPVPLKHTDIKAFVEGYIATVDVTQQYQNPFSEKIEAVYVFPLPADAAVSEFVMTIGERRIRGIVRERKEAEKIYHEARSQGYVASLLTQERPNVFTQSVANIEPGKAIDINIKYYNTLAYNDGWFEFVVPTVVGPRFNPPGFTQGIGAVSTDNAHASGQGTEVQYLRPAERSGHDIAIDIDLKPSVSIEQIQSVNHTIDTQRPDPNHAHVSLRAGDTIPNKDFVLRFRVAGEQIKSALIAHRDGPTGGYFTLMLIPPADLSNVPRKPLEMVFTIDVSGSQSGAPLAQSKAATRYCLTHMGPDDTFQVIRFGNTAKKLFNDPVPADPRHVQQALQYVDSLDAIEGTMLVDGLRASLLFPHDPSRLRFVTFLTDGFIGNEAEALAELHNDLGPARIFSFGVGSSTNRNLLDEMARMGNGTAAYLSLNEDANEVMSAYFKRISRPALTNIQIDWGALAVSDVFPTRQPDLFVGRPLILTGRFQGELPKQITLSGSIGNEQITRTIPVTMDDSIPDNKALPVIWARAKLGDLSDRAIWQKDDKLPEQMRQVALEYGLMSDYTAFIAVDAMTKTRGDHGTTVIVPVPVPDGVRYDTTVQTAPTPSPNLPRDDAGNNVVHDDPQNLHASNDHEQPTVTASRDAQSR